jgi:dihydrofolate reductase
LPGRVNLVITRNKNYAAPGCKVVSSVEEAIKFAEANEETELMIIGGGEIYREVFGIADKLYLTKVHHTFKNADTFFPEVTKFRWQPVFRERHFADEKHKYDFEFIVLEKKQSV